MIEENLQEFMDKVRIVNKDIVVYENQEKGLLYNMNLTHLLCRVDYLELEKDKLKEEIFKQKIDNKEYKMYDIEKKVPKSEVTKDKEDLFTITTKKVKATKIYNVSNAIGIHTTFEDAEEAFKLAISINEKVYANMG